MNHAQTIFSSGRATELRARCLARRHLSWYYDIHIDFESLKSTEGEPSWQRRAGRLTYDRLRTLSFAVDDLELLMGRRFPRADDFDARQSAEEKAYVQAQMPTAWGITGHCEIDRSKLFALGVDGMLADIRSRLASAVDEQAADAHHSFIDALEGFSLMCANAASVAQAAIPAAPSWRQAELREMAASCRRVARQPPESFRDAIQMLFLMDLAVMQGNGVAMVVPGHIDRTLAPYYERDVAEGRLDREKALTLVECLYLLINEWTPDRLAISIMVGGRDAHGRDVSNELSHIAFDALRRTRLVYPTVGLCWHEGTPKSLTDLAVEVVADGNANPAFFGDETIQTGLRQFGLESEEACNYINSTCVEITPVGSSNVYVASPYYNLCKHLLQAIDSAVKGAYKADTIADLMNESWRTLSLEIENLVGEINGCRHSRVKHGRKPMQSVFTKDCVEKGRDIDDGGARYNWVECSFVGLANLADSLHALDVEVFKSHGMSLARMKEILDADFNGFEAERKRLSAYPKYGNDAGEVDVFVKDIVAFVIKECAKHKIDPDGSPYIPGAFCHINHYRLGKETGATPDGRKRGAPFADGCGPAQGRERCGPTASVISTTSWAHSGMLGGLAYNLKFAKSLLNGERARKALWNLIEVFLRRGGFETQINVIDAYKLREAKAHPELFGDLVVRVAGYTDYFAKLPPELQDEVIERTEYDSLGI